LHPTAALANRLEWRYFPRPRVESVSYDPGSRELSLTVTGELGPEAIALVTRRICEANGVTTGTAAPVLGSAVPVQRDPRRRQVLRGVKKTRGPR